MAWQPPILYAQSVLGVDRVLYARDYPFQFAPEESEGHRRSAHQRCRQEDAISVQRRKSVFAIEKRAILTGTYEAPELMRLSTDRILTTHVGSLPRPQDVVDVLFA